MDPKTNDGKCITIISLCLYYRYVCDKFKQNEMKTIMRNCLGEGNVIKRLLNVYLTIKDFFHGLLK